MRAGCLLAVGTAVLLAASCTFNPSEIDQEPDEGISATLRMTQQADGRLRFCDAGGECHTLANPSDCAALTVEVNTQDGRTCEACEDASGQAIYESCSATAVVCTVVTPPEPDCVVCAYLGGAIIFSSCFAEEPSECTYITGTGESTIEPQGPQDGQPSCTEAECGLAPGMPNWICDDGTVAGPACARSDDGHCVWITRECVDQCKICYDPAGRPVVDECGNDCSHTVCAELACAPGFEAVHYPGECCPRCVLVDDCKEAVCAIATGLPECPPGTVLIQDPADCCGYFCEPLDCSSIHCPAVQLICPPGHHLDRAFPNCCGICVADDEARYCRQQGDCREDEVCTAGDECLPAPGCDSFQNCPDVCYGVCRPADHLCSDYDPWPQPDIGDTNEPATEPCEGEWASGGRDEFGCPLPSICVCPNGTVSLDGTCPDACSELPCFTPIPVCESGTHFEKGHPYCCGVCVPDDECWTGTIDPKCSDAEIICGSGQHKEMGPGCCPVCVEEMTPCVISEHCDSAEFCTTEIGECQLAPACDADGECSALCHGVCEPRRSCDTEEQCHKGHRCVENICMP